MAKILLFTTCVRNPDNSFAQREVFYTTGLLKTGVSPLSYALTTAISCAVFTLAAGTELERYCALAADGSGVLRVITATGFEFVSYAQTDTASSQCDGTCDLNTPTLATTPTTSPTKRDGKLRVDVQTSFPPLTAYNPQVGSPTRTTRPTAAGVLPATYILEWDNVPAGTYAVQIQDNGNCQLTTPLLTVAAGAALGGGAPGAIAWFKYETILDYIGTDVRLTRHGFAWNKTRKQGYQVAPSTLYYPDYYRLTPVYEPGDIVKCDTGGGSNPHRSRYYVATQRMVLASFLAANTELPFPTNASYWTEIPQYNKSKRFFDTPTTRTSVELDYFDAPSPTNNLDYYYYEEGTIVRYGWTGFYRAKYKVTSRTGSGKIPPPVPFTSTDEWEYVPPLVPFFYAIPEADVIDQYAPGAQVRLVRYHVYDPLDPGYVPTSSSSVRVVGGSTVPPVGDDFVLFDDNSAAVETRLGDLQVLDLIKTDIDTQGAENGSVAILATSPSLPLTFHLRNGVRPGYVQDNQTGIYEQLAPGAYVVDIYDANQRYTNVAFDILDEQRLRWKLTFDDTSANPLEIRIFQRNWDGAVTNVCGSGTPVLLSWDTGGDPGGGVPEAVGANLEFQAITRAVQQFVDTATGDDRHHRIDYYRNNSLQFRGYIDTTSYREALLGAGQNVILTATDGLGKLKNTKFINHRSERQTGRTTMLSIILKCLSFTDVNLPLICGNNLRDALMSADGEPFLEAYVNRTTYDKKEGKVMKDEDFIDCRTVLDAILRGFNCLLIQADGCWRIIALNEVHNPFAVRVFSPAGSLLTNVGTSALPLRLLPSEDATGEREVYWIAGSQSRTTVAAAQIVKATVDLKLETSLFRNGDFTQWDGTNSRPLYWQVQGNPTVTRTKGEKAKEYAAQFAAYPTTLTPGNYLVSPDAPHQPGQDEDGMVVKFKALLEPTTTNPAELSVTLNFQVVADGAPIGPLLPVVISTKDKWKEQTLNLPLGLPGTKVRVRLLQPVANNAESVASTLKVNYIALSIQPGLVDWSDVKQDFVEVINQDSVATGIRLEELALVHADLPRLPNFAGNPQPAKKMDVFAWRHAISLADFSATSAWKRPAYTSTAPLLDNAAQERMVLRAVPTTELSGEVKGKGINYLRTGLMLDMQELDGRFLVLSCFKNERAGTAQITLRRLADGDYGGLQPEVPDGARIATKNGKLGYRISFVNGVEGFRTATTL